MGDREMILARWGLVPFFTKDLKDIKDPSTINARSETITKAPTWREPFKKRRCLVPASAFFEWSKSRRRSNSLCLRTRQRPTHRLRRLMGRLEGQRWPLAAVVRYRHDGRQ